MSKKRWCRKCKAFEMKDSASQTDNEKLRNELKDIKKTIRDLLDGSFKMPSATHERLREHLA